MHWIPYLVEFDESPGALTESDDVPETNDDYDYREDSESVSSRLKANDVEEDANALTPKPPAEPFKTTQMQLDTQQRLVTYVEEGNRQFEKDMHRMMWTW